MLIASATWYGQLMMAGWRRYCAVAAGQWLIEQQGSKHFISHTNRAWQLGTY